MDLKNGVTSEAKSSGLLIFKTQLLVSRDYFVLRGGNSEKIQPYSARSKIGVTPEPPTVPNLMFATTFSSLWTQFPCGDFQLKTSTPKLNVRVS